MKVYSFVPRYALTCMTAFGGTNTKEAERNSLKRGHGGYIPLRKGSENLGFLREN